MESLKYFVLFGFIFYASGATTDSCKPQGKLGFHIYFFGSNNKEFCEFSEVGDVQNMKKILNNREKYVDSKKAKWIFLVYGFHENLNSESVQTILKAYKKREQFVIFVLEWSMYNNRINQVAVLDEAREIATTVGDVFYNKLHNQGVINLQLFEFVGISVGAHFTAFISRHIYENSKHFLKISRITAIDPAGRVYFDSTSLRVLEDHLNENDAKFVQVIHTDSIYWGTTEKLGHADFWPNGGTDQPNCDEFDWSDFTAKANVCPHRFGWMFFAESIENVNENVFVALECDAFSSLTWKICDKPTPNRTNFMGFNADPNNHGNFYLMTNSQAPFNKGLDGIITV